MEFSITYSQKFLRPLYSDTLVFEISNDPARKNDGNNRFTISLDPDNETQELNETNNTVDFDLYIPRGSTIHLYPQDYGIASNNSVEFVWQSADMLSAERSYSFECDTLPDFSSPFKVSDQVSGQLLIRKRVDIGSLPDSTTIYWRTKLTSPQSGEDEQWVTTSLSYLPASAEGWAQTSAHQITGRQYHRYEV